MRKFKILTVTAIAAILAVTPVLADTGYGKSESHSVSSEKADSDNIWDNFGNLNRNDGFTIGRGFSDPSTVTVSASASVFTEPDKASVQLEVTQEGKDAGETMKECSGKAETLIKVLKDKGVEEDDITTASTVVQPEYDYESQENKITGYTASIVVVVSNQDTDDIGSVISAAMKNGANGVGNLNFFCSDYDEKYEEALRKAVEVARKKADAVAEAGGIRVIRLESVTEGYQNSDFRYRNTNDALAGSATMKATGEAWEIPVSAGNAEITANITAIFEAE